MKTLSIGDIHGRSVWKTFTHGSIELFEIWKRQVINNEVNMYSYPLDDLDKIIFVGDYVDSFTLSNVEILDNLNDLILFKKEYPDKVMFLLGNHDIQYIKSGQGCSGFRGEMRYDLNKIFTDNIDLFQLTYQYKNTIWSHGGITSGWYKLFEEELNNPRSRFYSIITDELNSEATISDQINFGYKIGLDCIFNVDSASGGYEKWAGPLWARPRRNDLFPLEDYFQIVGHTHQDKILVTKNFAYIDCLEYGEASGYYLEI